MAYQSDVVLTSRIRLARNYDDLPFQMNKSSNIATVCIQRTLGALELEGLTESFVMRRMDNLERNEQKCLVESHLISKDLLKTPEVSAVLLNEERGLSIMMNEEDHIRLQVLLPHQQLAAAMQVAFGLEDALQRHLKFAFDPQLGYLTACPTNTGTGMRASLMMHLPMLTKFKQMGNVTQSLAKVGLTIRGMYGEGSEALGNVYQVSNQVTLGRTEQEILEAVTAVSRQLTDTERELRGKVADADKLALEDQAFRAYGTLKFARRIAQTEFMKLWSDLRLGAALEKLPLTTDDCDALLEAAQDAHVIAWAEKPLSGSELNEARASRIRELIK